MPVRSATLRRWLMLKSTALLPRSLCPVGLFSGMGHTILLWRCNPCLVGAEGQENTWTDVLISFLSHSASTKLPGEPALSRNTDLPERNITAGSRNHLSPLGASNHLSPLGAGNASTPSMALCRPKRTPALRNGSSLRCTLHSSVQTPLLTVVSVNLGMKLHGLSRCRGWTWWQHGTQQPCCFPASAAHPQRHPPCKQGPRQLPLHPTSSTCLLGRETPPAMSHSSETEAPEPGNQRFPSDVDCASDW